MQYYTQMQAAKNGVITEEMKKAASYEGIKADALRDMLAQGVAVIPANKNHKSLEPRAIGERLKTKINVNLGISKDSSSQNEELEKVIGAIKLGADAIMDLSTSDDTKGFRKKLTQVSTVMLGSVPIYDALVFYKKPLQEISAKDWLEVVRMHAMDGIDFVTVHAGLNKHTIEKFKKSKSRITNIVSRGGSLMFAWMEMTGNENPFYEYFDELLEICREFDVTISLGDACRPGSTHDASDACQIEELITLGELTKRAWERDVQVIVEGPGHMSLDQIETNMKIQKSLCHGAPFYVLGPLVTDIAPGYDHITSAIGGAIAAWHGAAFLCYVTPAEHLRLPTYDDMKEGIIASKIAAHAADIAKKIPNVRNWDDNMSKARQRVDWDSMFNLAIDPEKARRYRAESMPECEDTCSMCGEFCSMRNMNKILNGESVDINVV
ncbi:MAG: phosphomethylpyrimidine synthase ThiC [Campylobacteraceae bacterium]|jgi:phosphomethylpyrimidine synthase|nr:phosphomethylpyrimidine synthase ThiC [Campylobacteraceae bacterium]